MILYFILARDFQGCVTISFLCQPTPTSPEGGIFADPVDRFVRRGYLYISAIAIFNPSSPVTK
jgi:hypothetical protein